MSQQGETGHRQEDEWWGQLYGERAEPAAPDRGDTVDDRYASALGAMGAEGAGSGQAARSGQGTHLPLDAQDAGGAQGASGTLRAQGTHPAQGAQDAQDAQDVQGPPVAHDAGNAQGGQDSHVAQGVSDAAGTQGPSAAQGASGTVGAQGGRDAQGSPVAHGTWSSQGPPAEPGARDASGAQGLPVAQGASDTGSAQGAHVVQAEQNTSAARDAQGAHDVRDARGSGVAQGASDTGSAQGAHPAQGAHAACDAVQGAPAHDAWDAQGPHGAQGGQGVPAARGAESVPGLRPWQYQGAPAGPTASGDGPWGGVPVEPPPPAPGPTPGLPPGWAPAETGPGRPAGAAGAGYVGDGPPTYEPEPSAWPLADPGRLDDLVPDTVLDGAQYGVLTVRSASVRGDSARYRGEPRRDALLAARFGAGDDALLLLAVAGGPRASDVAHRAAQDACRWIAGAVGRSHGRLAEDLRASRRGSLKSGLHRLTDRCYGRLRARAGELALDPAQYTASLRCLLLPADPECRTRLFFGAGEGGLFRIRAGEWQDLEPLRSDDGEPEDRIPGQPAIRFRFRASVAQPGDTLLLCSGGLAEPLRGEPGLTAHLVRRWGSGRPPGLAAFLGDTQTRVKGYADDRTAVAVWEG